MKLKTAPRHVCYLETSSESKRDLESPQNPYDWFAPARKPKSEWLRPRELAYVAYPDAKRAAQLESLESFKTLQRGWDSYNAEPPSETAIANARHILHVIWSIGLASPVRTVSPSVEGGVGIVFTASDQRYADIECFNDGEILAITSEGTTESSVWSLNGEAGTLRHAIEKISAFLNG